MKVNLDFSPRTFLEMVSDYVYTFYDEDNQTVIRKTLKTRLFDEVIPRLYSEHINLFLFEVQDKPTRGLYIIHPSNTVVVTKDLVRYQKFQNKFVTDEQMLNLMDSIHNNQNIIFQQIQRSEGEQFEKMYKYKQQFTQNYISKQYYFANTLENYYTSDKLNGEYIKQIQQSQKLCVENKIYLNILNSIKKNIENNISHQQHVQQPRVKVTLQDFQQTYIKKDLELLDQKGLVINPYVSFIYNEHLCLYPIQPSLPLCDNPNKQWFYVNEVRDHYEKPVEQLPYGRCFIRGNSLQQPSNIQQDRQLHDTVEEIAQRYTKYEQQMIKTVYYSIRLIHQNYEETVKLLQLLKQEIAKLEQKPTIQQFIGNNEKENNIQQKQDEVEEFLLNNADILQFVKYNYNLIINNDILTQQQKEDNLFLKILQHKLTLPLNVHQSVNYLMDFDEIFVNTPYNSTISQIQNKKTQSIFSSYTNDQNVNEDTIKIQIEQNNKIVNYYVNKEYRTRTTYESIVALNQCLLLMIYSGKNTFPIIKRPFTYVLLFNERINLKNLFISLEQLQYIQDSDILNRINKKDQSFELQQILLEQMQQGSRQKSASIKLVEDQTGGDCGVCGSRYDNYKQHVNSQDHIRNFKKMLQDDGKTDIKLAQYNTKFERSQATNAQLSIIAQHVACDMNTSYKVAANAVNKSLAAIGGQMQIDIDDTPRCNSPTTQKPQFVQWYEAVHQKRMLQLESDFQRNEVRNSAYKRIVSSSSTTAVIIMNNKLLKEKQFTTYLKQLFQNSQNIQQLEQLCNSHINDTDDSFYIGKNEENEKNMGNIVQLQLQQEPRYWFQDNQYDQLCQIVCITLLLRKCTNQQLLRDIQCNMQYSDVKQEISSVNQQLETQLYNDQYRVELFQQLQDQNPEINNAPYIEQLQKLQASRLKYYNENKNYLLLNQQTNSNTQNVENLGQININFLKLKKELANIEIGYVPDTDELIHIYRHVNYLEQKQNEQTIQKLISVDDLLNLAIYKYNNQQLTLLNSQLNYSIKNYLHYNKISSSTDINNHSSKDNVVSHNIINAMNPVNSMMQQNIQVHVNIDQHHQLNYKDATKLKLPFLKEYNNQNSTQQSIVPQNQIQEEKRNDTKYKTEDLKNIKLIESYQQALKSQQLKNQLIKQQKMITVQQLGISQIIYDNILELNITSQLSQFNIKQQLKKVFNAMQQLFAVNLISLLFTQSADYGQYSIQQSEEFLQQNQTQFITFNQEEQYEELEDQEIRSKSQLGRYRGARQIFCNIRQKQITSKFALNTNNSYQYINNIVRSNSVHSRDLRLDKYQISVILLNQSQINNSEQVEHYPVFTKRHKYGNRVNNGSDAANIIFSHNEQVDQIYNKICENNLQQVAAQSNQSQQVIIHKNKILIAAPLLTKNKDMHYSLNQQNKIRQLNNTLQSSYNSRITQQDQAKQFDIQQHISYIPIKQAQLFAAHAVLSNITCGSLYKVQNELRKLVADAFMGAACSVSSVVGQATLLNTVDIFSTLVAGLGAKGKIIENRQQDIQIMSKTVQRCISQELVDEFVINYNQNDNQYVNDIQIIQNDKIINCYDNIDNKIYSDKQQSKSD